MINSAICSWHLLSNERYNMGSNNLALKGLNKLNLAISQPRAHTISVSEKRTTYIPNPYLNIMCIHIKTRYVLFSGKIPYEV